MQASEILMIEPVNFAFNPETAVNNRFQKEVVARAQHLALQEFKALAQLLEKNDIGVTVIKDTPEPFTPDSIFPNNWISFHPNNDVVIYPMFASNRRLEKKAHVLECVKQKFRTNKVHDLGFFEASARFLEGTGSMVLDHANSIAYAAISERTNTQVLDEFCRLEGYTAASFTAADRNGHPIYHTNVLMCSGESFVVICLDAIPQRNEKEKLERLFAQTNKELIPISIEQMEQFAGNMLQLRNKKGELLLVMSSRAFHSLEKRQVERLERNSRIIHSPLHTIETCGGGSARCMIAEVFNQLQ